MLSFKCFSLLKNTKSFLVLVAVLLRTNLSSLSLGVLLKAIVSMASYLLHPALLGNILLWVCGFFKEFKWMMFRLYSNAFYMPSALFFSLLSIWLAKSLDHIWVLNVCVCVRARTVTVLQAS